jgi:hypothetical protein
MQKQQACQKTPRDPQAKACRNGSRKFLHLLMGIKNLNFCQMEKVIQLLNGATLS